MARVVLPEGKQISGSTGGTTHSHNRFGPYERSRSIPVNPNTDRQVTVRNIVRALSIAWQNTLTEGQRGGWEGYAQMIAWTGVLGTTAYLTGLNMYSRSNVARLMNGLTRIDDAPVIFNLAPAELALAVTASEATQQLSVGFDDTEGWCSEDGAMQVVYMGNPVNPSVKFFGGPFRLAGVILGDSVTPASSPALIAVPFPFSDGHRIWVRTRIGLADGRLSEFAQVNFLGAA